MSNYFCDSELTTGANDGTSFDDAWQTIASAFNSSSPQPGDILWIRRRSSHLDTLLMQAIDGTLKDPGYIIGCPRNVKTGTGDFVNGSVVVANLSFIPKF